MIVVIMGVSGSGKTTIGGLLADRLGVPFHDADDFHPQSNVEKMRCGEVLSDHDRLPWLRLLADRAHAWEQSVGAVLSCSALKEAYRTILRDTLGETLRFVYLKGDAALIAERLRERKGHFMPATLLPSQLNTLEEPQDAFPVSIDAAPESIVDAIIDHLYPKSLGPQERKRTFTVEMLKELKPSKGFFIGIDSDGCLFDSMEIKHKECFCPAFVNHFGMQAASTAAREVWDFVNLYSTTRGCNRFHAVLRSLDLLAQHPTIRARGVTPPKMQGLRDWIQRESKLSNPALEAEVARTHDPDLARALAWSVDVNAAVHRIVRNVPPFPLVREALTQMETVADSIVVSQTPTEALVREWKEHRLDGHVRLIAGQELGTKSEHISFATAGKYPSANILMIGDAPGDHKAAQSNNALFFPIVPGNEEYSWKLFYEEGLGRFLAGSFSGEYQEKLLEEFNRRLPEHPSWG